MVTKVEGSENKGSVIKESRIHFRGFASMPRDKIVETARAGGLARSRQLGHAGYVALGKLGGRVRSMQLTHEGFVEMGRKGGLSRKKIKDSAVAQST